MLSYISVEESKPHSLENLLLGGFRIVLWRNPLFAACSTEILGCSCTYRSVTEKHHQRQLERSRNAVRHPKQL